MTLKQSQGYQTGYELGDPEQGYNDAKFEKLPRTVSLKKQMINFVKTGNKSIISLTDKNTKCSVLTV